MSLLMILPALRDRALQPGLRASPGSRSRSCSRSRGYPARAPVPGRAPDGARRAPGAPSFAARVGAGSSSRRLTLDIPAPAGVELPPSTGGEESMKRLSLACVIAGLLLAAAPARAADPPLDLERLTVADAGSKMAAGQLTSVQLTRAYINRIAAINARGPGLNAVRIAQPAGADGRVAARPRARHRPRPRPAARRAGAGQGQPRRRRPADDRGQRRAAEQRAGQGLDRRRAAARRRRRDPRQDEPDRVRELHVHHRHAQRLLEPRRAGAEPVRPRLRHQRVVAPARARPPPPASPRSRSARRPPARSCQPVGRCRASSACGRRSAWSAGPASCRSPRRRTRPGR